MSASTRNRRRSDALTSRRGGGEVGMIPVAVGARQRERRLRTSSPFICHDDEPLRVRITPGDLEPRCPRIARTFDLHHSAPPLAGAQEGGRAIYRRSGPVSRGHAHWAGFNRTTIDGERATGQGLDLTQQSMALVGMSIPECIRFQIDGRNHVRATRVAALDELAKAIGAVAEDIERLVQGEPALNYSDADLEQLRQEGSARIRASEARGPSRTLWIYHRH